MDYFALAEGLARAEARYLNPPDPREPDYIEVDFGWCHAAGVDWWATLAVCDECGGKGYAVREADDVDRWHAERFAVLPDEEDRR